MSDKVLEFEFPLRPHFTATLWLPADLNAREVERLTRFLRSIVACEHGQQECSICDIRDLRVPAQVLSGSEVKE